MARISLDINLTPLLEEIQRANGNVEAATMKAAEACTEILEDSLKASCNASGISGSISGAIKGETEKLSGGNVYKSSAGWKMGSYNPRDPSPGYLALFFNYGTGKREVKTEKLRVNVGGKWETLSKNRGSISARRFLDDAKKDAKPKVKKAQEGILNEILGGLKQ